MRGLTFLLLLAFSACQGTPEEAFKPRQGDLFFQDIDCGSYCDAIERVTVGYKGCKTSHVGVFVEIENAPFIIEARSIGVVKTPLADFLKRNVDSLGQPKVYVGRIENLSEEVLSKAKMRMLSLLGKPYDNVYIPQDSAYYCSELVQECFLNKANEPLFSLSPMTFVDPVTGETFENWKDYFSELNMEVPEGEPGINPGGISTAKGVSIVHFYGYPDGCQGVSATD